MDLQQIIKDQGPALVQQLTTKIGLAPAQAQSFLSMLAAKLMELVKGGSFDIKSLLGGVDLSGLIGKLGLGQIASKVGIDEAKATAAAKTVLPGLLDGLKNQAGGLGGMLGSAADAVKKATGLFGKG